MTDEPARETTEAIAPGLSALVEIYPGAWLYPEQVAAVIAIGRHPQFDKVPATVYVKMAPGGWDACGWEFETGAEARTFAAKIAAAINEVVAQTVRK